MPGQHRLGDLRQADAAQPGCRAGEIAPHQPVVQPQRVENLRAAVAVHRGDTHLGHHLEQPLFQRLAVVLHRLLDGHALAVPPGQLDLVGDGLQGQPGIDRAGAVADQRRQVMHVARLAGFHDQAGVAADAGGDQRLMHGRGRQQSGRQRVAAIHAAVGEDQQARAAANCRDGVGAQPVDGRFQPAGTLGCRPGCG